MNKEFEKLIFSVKEEIASLLGIAVEDIEDNNSPIALGIDSLTLMRLAIKLKKMSIDITFAELIELKTFKEWWEVISAKEQKIEKTQEYLDVDESLFRLAPMQNAYVLGRSPGQPLGGVAAHFYEEFDGIGIDPTYLENAINQVISRHSMLRLSVSQDGYGKILEKSPWKKLKINDFKTCSKEEAQIELLKIREKLSGTQLDIEKGEVLDISLSLLPKNDLHNNPTRLHINLEMVAADAMSLRIIMRDLARSYQKGENTLKPLNYSFPRYLIDKKEIMNTKEAEVLYQQDKKYWNEKIDTLPTPISFKGNNEKSNPITRRRAFWLDKKQYEQFEKNAQKQEITPAMAFAAAFAETISAYSDQDSFILNIPLFNRESIHPEVDELVGDFTSSILASWRGGNNKKSSFIERAKYFQEEFHSDAAHARYTGIDLLRELTRRRGERVFASVVYTSAIGLGELFSEEVVKNFGKPTWIISQGPQVELDAQVTQVDGGILVNWDAREDIISPKLLDGMFEGFQRMITTLAHSEEAWNEQFIQVMPKNQIGLRESINIKAMCSPKDRGIHETFFREALKRGEDLAVCWSENQNKSGSISHRTLAKKALSMAGSLVSLGVKKGDRVVVSLPKGSNQVISVLAILAAGGVYVPISTSEPEKRRQKIIDSVKAKVIIDSYSFLPNVEPLKELVPVSGSDSAYILFTSGSTGEPKGVEVSHAAALNTILALNRVFEVGKNDRSLAISALEFDLSVYDIFGLLEAGGSVVFPKAEDVKNGEAWLNLIETHKITLLNCAPILLDILLEATDKNKKYKNLKKVLLGGDRIPGDVYTRVREVFGPCRIAGLGGTTETAIHSTIFEIKEPLPSGSSVPYGWPLDGVQCRIVDFLGRDCPDGIAGELWIGGNSVAKGYINDSKLTEKKFLSYKGIRWYKTGDRVRYLPEACIEFLGRIDNQIKIKGQRVEIGEIENALEGDYGVSRAMATCINLGSSYKIVAAISPVFKQNHNSKKIFSLPSNQESVEDGLQHKVVNSFIKYLLSNKSQYNDTPIQLLWKQWLKKQKDEVIEKWPMDLEGGTWIEPIVQRLSEKENDIWAISQGEIDPLCLLEDKVLSPGSLLNALPDTENTLRALSSVISNISKNNNGTVKILELGSMGGVLEKRLIELNSKEIIEWGVFDKSKEKVELTCKTIGNISSGIVVKNGLIEEEKHNVYDMVIALGTLHTMNENIATAIRSASIMCKKEAPILVMEMPVLPPLGLISAALLENGFVSKDSISKGYNNYMKDKVIWRKILEKNHVTGIVDGDIGKFSIIAGLLPESKANIAHIRSHIKKVLPEVMHPSKIFITPEIELNKNGKIDRKKISYTLSNSLESIKDESRGNLPKAGTTEEVIAEIWKELLSVGKVYLGDDFFSLGGDSLIATRFVFRARQMGYKDASLSILFAHPKLKDFSERLQPTEIINKEEIKFLSNEKYRYLPFPCTAVQRAYLVGRRSDFILGGVGTHVYNEFDSECLDISRLERAINILVNRHEMLRTIFNDEGTQKILSYVPKYSVVELSDNMSKEEAIKKLRKEMSHQAFDAKKWPLFDVQVAHYVDEEQVVRTRLGISLDNIVADGLSMMIILSELSSLYENPLIDLNLEYGTTGVSFRDYVLATMPNKVSLDKSREYWKKRVKTLPAPPDLPLCANPEDLSAPTFVRRQMVVTKDELRNLEEKGKSEGVTIPIIFLAAYCEALATWSGQAAVSVTVTLFDRLNLHPDINHIVGDFTTLLIAGYKADLFESWSSVLRTLQKQLWSDLDYRNLPISEVLRFMANEESTPATSIPVVFTGAIGVSEKYSMVDQASYGKRAFTLSQTPQIWMDLQIREIDQGVEVALDAVDEIFLPGVLDGLFETIRSTIKILSQNSWENVVSSSYENIRLQEYRSWKSIKKEEGKTLHGPLFKNANIFPNKTALIFGDKKISYGELRDYSLEIAGKLFNKGIRKNDPVVISLPRGIDQIAVVLGILAVGGVYIPISVNQPEERKKQIIKDVKPCAVIDSMEFLKESGSLLSSPVDILDDSSAYIIYTSGSTGKSKGVEISHGAARNTIDEVIRKWNISKLDVVLNVASLDFDLSVFDIFGLLAVGGSIVLIEEQNYRDPEKWANLISLHNVSIWNSAPALLEMLTTVTTEEKKWDTLRLALVSGDWIPLELPKRWYEISNPYKSIFVALGGATEASIWSNFFEVKEVSNKWNSIPYGNPLKGQKYRIVDQRGKDCPPWVTGELWIGGYGLAKGYVNSYELTSKKFIVDDCGMRWYKTGDLGRFWEDGTIEFLGRKDTQIKIRGHRIELGEIESHLKLHPHIEEAVVVPCGDRYHKVLNAFYSGKKLSDDELNKYLSSYLSNHSIPNSYHYIEDIPLTVNGKVNRRALELIAEEKIISKHNTIVEAKTDTEKILVSLWKEILETDIYDCDANLFFLGADSLSATRFIERLRRQHGISLPLKDVFSNPTVRGLAEIINQYSNEDTSVHMEEGVL